MVFEYFAAELVVFIIQKIITCFETAYSIANYESLYEHLGYVGSITILQPSVHNPLCILNIYNPNNHVNRIRIDEPTKDLAMGHLRM